jgi:hypothetical protein
VSRAGLPDFGALAEKAHASLGSAGARKILDAGRVWDLAPVLRAGGAVLFPHAGIESCGHQTAAAVHACLDCGASRVLVIGTLHALTEELDRARARVADGGDPAREASWGIQGPGLTGRDDWKREFSLKHFLFLWGEETRRRGVRGPEIVVRYPYLAGGHPERLPGIRDVAEAARDAAVVATGDLFHHGIGYGDAPEQALAPESGGLELARRRIDEGLSLLAAGDFAGYNAHCVAAKSDARDVGQLLAYLRGPIEGRILDLVSDDTAASYGAPAPTWVAGALVAFALPRAGREVPK